MSGASSFGAKAGTAPLPPGARFIPFAEEVTQARVSVNSEGTIVHVNKRAESLFGYPADRLIGQPVTMLMPERFRDAHRTGFERFRDTRQGQLVGSSSEMVAVRSDGTEFAIELSLGSWTSPDDELFVFATIRDISEQKRAEAERQALLNELRELSQAREQLLEDVAHELRGPLTSLGLIASLYTDLDSSELPKLMEQAARAISQIQTLVDDMLDARNIEAGRFVIHREDVDARQIIDEAIELIQPQIAAAGQQIRRVLPRGRLPIVADRKHLVRALLNLLSNGSKYSPNGEVIEVKAELAGEGLRISVKDHGPGIPEDARREVFQRFYRAHSGRQRPGVGLGLAIVKGIVEAHQGEVGITSRVGQGSEFWFTLPSSPR